MLVALVDVGLFLLRILSYVIIAQFILSLLLNFNVINRHNDFMRGFMSALDTLTEPLYRPIRRLLPDLGGIDFSPMIVIILIAILRILLGGVRAEMMMA